MSLRSNDVCGDGREEVYIFEIECEQLVERKEKEPIDDEKRKREKLFCRFSSILVQSVCSFTF
jgi:hypothetical protein